MLKTERGARITRIANPSGALPKLLRGGKVMAATKTASRARNAKRGGKKKTTASKSRSRSRNSASVNPARSTAPKVVYRYRTAKNPAAKKNPSRKRKGSRGRFGARSKNPFSVAGIGEILKELGYAGGGAFTVSTLTQVLPIPVSSPLAILVVQGVLSWIAGWLGGKVFGKKNEAMIRTGGFAFAAGNFVQNQFPGLQQKILSFSPIRGARSAALPNGAAQAAALTAGGNGGPPPLSDSILTSDELNDISLAHPYLQDISLARQY